jgi:L-lysine 2,3-aminomutase
MLVRYTTRRLLLLTTAVAVVAGAFCTQRRLERLEEQRLADEHWEQIIRFSKNYPFAPQGQHAY